MVAIDQPLEFKIYCKSNNDKKNTTSFEWKTDEFKEIIEETRSTTSIDSDRVKVEINKCVYLELPMDLDEVSSLQTQMENQRSSFPAEGENSSLGYLIVKISIPLPNSLQILHFLSQAGYLY